MKKLLFIILFTTTILSKAATNNYNITFNIKGIKNEKAILAYYFSDKKYIKDTIEFKNGIGKITGKKDIPNGVYLVAFPSMNLKYFDIIIKENNFTLTTDTADFGKNMIVKNSIENKLLYDDVKFMFSIGIKLDSLRKEIVKYKLTDANYTKIEKQITELNEKATNYRIDLVKKNPTLFYTKVLKMMKEIEPPKTLVKKDGITKDTAAQLKYIQDHYFDNIDFKDSGLLRTPIFQNRLMNYFTNYVSPEPDSIIPKATNIIEKARLNNAEMYQFILSTLFSNYANSNIMGFDNIYVELAEKYYLSGKTPWTDAESIKKLQDRITALKPTLIGNIAPNFSVIDTLYNNHNLYEEITKNEYTIVVFWNSDCHHCQKEIPILKQKYEDTLRNYKVGVLAISTEQNETTFRKFVSENCSKYWSNCFDYSGLSNFRKEYDIISTPKLYIIDKTKKIIAKNIPVDEIINYIQFLNKKNRK